MKNSNKDANLKEKLKQALNSTFKVISDDFQTNKKLEKKESLKDNDFFKLDSFNSLNLNI